MLNSLVIKNFRMLEDFTVSKLGRVNLIVGKNNSGKSTVLEALRIYAGNANPQLLENIASRRDEIGSRLLYEDLFTGRKFPESKHPDEGEYYDEFHPDTEDEEIFIAESDGENNSRKIYIWSTGESFYASRGIYRRATYNGYEYLDNFKPEIPCSFAPTQFIETDKLEREWNDITLNALLLLVTKINVG